MDPSHLKGSIQVPVMFLSFGSMGEGRAIKGSQVLLLSGVHKYYSWVVYPRFKLWFQALLKSEQDELKLVIQLHWFQTQWDTHRTDLNSHGSQAKMTHIFFCVCNFIYWFYFLVYFIDYAITVVPIFPLYPPPLSSPLPSSNPLFSSYPWVVHIISLASPFLILFLTAPSILYLPSYAA